RVAVVAEPDGGTTQGEVAGGVRRAADALADAGYAVEEIRPPPVAEAFDAWAKILFTEVKVLWPLLQSMLSDDARRFLEYGFAEWPPEDRDGLVMAWTDRRRIGREWRAFQADHALVLGPAMTCEPFEVGFDLRGRAEAAEVVHHLRLLT